jgi:putative tricarboxylic transport membrane protein
MNTSNLDRLRFSVLGREVTVNPGETLLPAIVLIGCGIYYGGTRGLPDQSMVYAGPLLYGTAALAVITLVQHTFSIGEEDDVAECPAQVSEERTASSATDAAARTTDKLRDDTEPDSENRHFNRYTAAGLVVLSFGYVFSLGMLRFILPTAVFLAALVTLFGERRPTYIATYSVVLTIVTWTVFVYWLNIPL